MSSTPQLKLTSMNALRHSISNMLGRYTEENKKLTVLLYGIRVIETYLNHKAAVELTGLATRLHKTTENNSFESTVNKVLAYYQEFKQVVVDKNE